MGIKVTYEPLQDQAELHPGKSALMFCQGQKSVIWVPCIRVLPKRTIWTIHFFSKSNSKTAARRKAGSVSPDCESSDRRTRFGFCYGYCDTGRQDYRFDAFRRSGTDQRSHSLRFVHRRKYRRRQKSVAFRVVLAPKETLTEDKTKGHEKIIDRVTDEFALTLRK